MADELGWCPFSLKWKWDMTPATQKKWIIQVMIHKKCQFFLSFLLSQHIMWIFFFFIGGAFSSLIFVSGAFSSLISLVALSAAYLTALLSSGLFNRAISSDIFVDGATSSLKFNCTKSSSISDRAKSSGILNRTKTAVYLTVPKATVSCLENFLQTVLVFLN